MLRPRSLRVRLALLCVAVFGLIQVLLAAIHVVVRDISLRRDFDQFLAARADSFAEAIELAAGATSGAAPHLPQGRPRAGHWEIRGPDGALLDKSGTLGDLELPWPGGNPPPPGGREFRTLVSGPAAEALGSLRVVRQHELLGDGRSYVLQVARETAIMESSIAEMRRLVVVLIIAGLLFSGAAAIIVAHRSLQPLVRVIREARTITAEGLSRRLPQPQVKDEIGELCGVLNEMLARLDSAFQAQKRFVANISHELKTPLVALAAEAQTAARPDTPELQRLAFLQRTHRTLEHKARLVDGLLTLARAEAGLPLNREQVIPLAELITDSVHQCSWMAQQRDVRIRAKLPLPSGDDVECTIRGEWTLLNSLVENLLRNAIAHTPPGSVVDVELACTPTHAQIIIADQGPGIPPERLHEAFVRFQRLDNSEPRPRNPGAGLGLAIARSVAELHGGSIAGEPRPEAEGGGFRMRISLPQDCLPAPA